MADTTAQARVHAPGLDLHCTMYCLLQEILDGTWGCPRSQVTRCVPGACMGMLHLAAMASTSSCRPPAQRPTSKQRGTGILHSRRLHCHRAFCSELSNAHSINMHTQLIPQMAIVVCRDGSRRVQNAKTWHLLLSRASFLGTGRTVHSRQSSPRFRTSCAV